MTTTIYKLTCKGRTTHNGFKWTPGEWYETSGDGELCGPGWLHCYDDPLLAVLLNPIHAQIANPLLWRGEAEGKMRDDHGLKQGWTRMRIVERMAVPEITTARRARCAIYCAQAAVGDTCPAWSTWADGWLRGERDVVAAAVAEAAASAASWASTGEVAWAAARSARAAAKAAQATRASAEAAAQASAWAAEAAAQAMWVVPINLKELARRAIAEETE